MKVIKGLVKGPFKDEAAFKAAVIKAWQKDAPLSTMFQIENEEKEPGMPDVLSISRTSPAFFTEFKISDAKGIIEFTKAQPLFYRKHGDLLINILAWDMPRKRVVQITPVEVIDRCAVAIHPKGRQAFLVRIPEEIDDVETIG